MSHAHYPTPATYSTRAAPEFFWSYSALKNYETCPKRYYHYNVEKDVKEPESDQLREGSALHRHFDARIKSNTPLPLGYGQYEPLLDKLANAPGTVYTEQKLALTSEFTPVAYFGKGVWFRTVIDYTVLRDDATATIIDYKTGKPNEDITQLQLMSATLFASSPRVERIKAALLFVHHDARDVAEFTRGDLPEIWGEILPRVEKVKEARQMQNYPPQPSGLCRKWCAVVTCPHHGR